MQWTCVCVLHRSWLYIRGLESLGCGVTCCLNDRRAGDRPTMFPPTSPLPHQHSPPGRWWQLAWPGLTGHRHSSVKTSDASYMLTGHSYLLWISLELKSSPIYGAFSPSRPVHPFSNRAAFCLFWATPGDARGLLLLCAQGSPPAGLGETIQGCQGSAWVSPAHCTTAPAPRMPFCGVASIPLIFTHTRLTGYVPCKLSLPLHRASLHWHLWSKTLLILMKNYVCFSLADGAFGFIAKKPFDLGLQRQTHISFPKSPMVLALTFRFYAFWVTFCIRCKEGNWFCPFACVNTDEIGPFTEMIVLPAASPSWLNCLCFISEQELTINMSLF